MYPSSSPKLLFPLSIIFLLFTPSLSNPIFPANTTITLFGDASLNSTRITLTRGNTFTPSPPAAAPVIGRAFYVDPVRFLDPSSNATASFSCGFSFTITTAAYCPFSGEGFAFLITSNTTPSNLDGGYMGLPPNQEYSYLAVEFDTNFDPNLKDINANHVGVDLNSVQSIASVDLGSRQIDLKNGKELRAWIEYRDSENTIKIWVWCSEQNKPVDPVLVTQIDLSVQLKEFMYIGFTASNGKSSSSSHIVDTWQFNTSFTMVPMDATEQGDCSGNSFDYLQSSTRMSSLVPLLWVFAVVVILVVAAFVVVYLCVINRRTKKVETERRITSRMMVPRMLSLSEIRNATDGFDRGKILGEGASAIVYQGAIPSFGPVAVKRFNRENELIDSSTSFDTEFTTMAGCLRHKNLVQLQGWCCEKDELALVYEYMPNGSLDQILHNNNQTNFLTWEKRMNIVQGIASALVYLHEECENQIIHRDVKTCNILLDSQFNAKLGDFGLAEVYRHDLSSRFATVPAGTMGYLAPEYVFSGVPTVKSDVYSFGVVVLEVATGRRAVEEGVAEYVWGLWEKGMIGEAGDGRLMGGFEREEMERVLMVGLLCVLPDCEKRPAMREAAAMLAGEVAVTGLPVKKPAMRIQAVAPMTDFDDDDDDVTTTPWSTPGTHFSKN